MYDVRPKPTDFGEFLVFRSLWRAKWHDPEKRSRTVTPAWLARAELDPKIDFHDEDEFQKTFVSFHILDEIRFPFFDATPYCIENS
jgi:hypothetical protein